MHASINVPDEFGFTVPTRVSFKVGAAEGIADEVKALGGSRVLVVSEKGIIAAGVTDPILRRLQDAGLEPRVFDQFSPEPSDFECFGGLEAAKEHEADILIGVGGGSSMDMAKVVGTLMTNGGGPLDYAGMDLIEHPLPPVITVPTTAGTGSEVTAFAVVTDTPNRVKVNLVSPHLAPKLALLDPMLTVTMPAHVTAATGMDAFCHAFESYTCRVANPITEGLALYAMELIGRYLTVAVEDGGNTDARTKMQLASTIAGLAFSNSDCCGVHCMGESLGGMVDMLHGVACAIFLPHVFQFNMSADLAKHARVGEALGLDLSDLSLAEAAQKTLDRLIQWEADLGIPHLRDVPGVHPEEFDLAAQGAVESVCASSQPRPTSHADYRRMFEEAYSLESSGPSSPSVS